MKKVLSLLLALAVAFAIPAGPGLYVADAATDGIAISTADDLKAMEKNPSGSYYLANDIEVPANLILFTDSQGLWTAEDINSKAIPTVPMKNGLMMLLFLYISRKQQLKIYP